MKRLVLYLALALLLALAACGGQPESQDLLPTGAAETPITGDTGSLPTGVPPVEGAPQGEMTVPALAGTTWEWVDLTTPVETITAVDSARYVIQFNADGTAFITADCNSVRATYEATADGSITITPGPSTLVACPEDTQDQVFLGALAAAANYFMLSGNGDLFMDQLADAGTLRFRPAGGAATGAEGEQPTAAGLTGTTWEWVSLIDSTGQTAATDPTRYTITFNEDGTANVMADCNSVMAQYVTDGANLSISPGAGTLVACEADSQDQLFLNSLLGAATFLVQDSELFVALEGGTDTLVFRSAAAAGGESDAPGSTGAPSLTGVTWQWTETATTSEATTVADPTRYAIVFNDDGTVNVTADCNSVLGTYTTADDGTMTITLGPSTLVGCPEDSQADAFVQGLAGASGFAFDGDDLLIDAGDTATLRFSAAEGAAAGQGEGETGAETTMSLTGATWQWVETVTPTETVTAADPTRYTITFNEDGTASIKADCNQVTATYTVADSSLTITPGASTLAMCPEDSQATPFLAGLSSAAVFFFQDGFLYIDQFASSGTMKFAATGAATEEPGKGQTGAPAGDLVGPVWQLTLITKVDGNITINDPTRYTISFNADGTANLQADCNVGGANYTTGEGNTLTITPTVSTMAFCGPGSLDQVYLGGLTNAMGYQLEDGNLIIDMLYESGSLVFMPAP